MTLAQRVINTGAMLVIVVALGLLGLVIYWLVYPPRPVAEVKSPAKIITPVVATGDRLIYEIDYCVYKQVPVTLIRRFSNGIVLTMDPLEAKPPVGCGVDQVGSTIIPDHMPPGMYKLKLTALHQVNPIRTDEVLWETEVFEITE